MIPRYVTLTQQKLNQSVLEVHKTMQMTIFPQWLKHQVAALLALRTHIFWSMREKAKTSLK